MCHGTGINGYKPPKPQYEIDHCKAGDAGRVDFSIDRWVCRMCDKGPCYLTADDIRLEAETVRRE